VLYVNEKQNENKTKKVFVYECLIVVFHRNGSGLLFYLYREGVGKRVKNFRRARTRRRVFAGGERVGILKNKNKEKGAVCT